MDYPVTLIPLEMRKRLGQRGKRRYVRLAIHFYGGQMSVIFQGTRLFVEETEREDCDFIATSIAGYMMNEHREILSMQYGRISLEEEPSPEQE